MKLSGKEFGSKNFCKTKFAVIAALFIFTAILSACETADDNNLEQARTCIDAAARQVNSNSAGAIAKATECDTLVTNMSTPESGKIGFGAMLIIEGKFSQIPTLVTALQGTSNTLATGFTYLVFSSTTNTTKMSTYSTRSASAGIQKIAGYITAANLINSIGAITDVNSVKTTVAGINANNASNPSSTEGQLAASLLALQTSTCAGAASTSANCTKINQAVGTSTDPVAVLTAFKAFVAAGS